MALLECGPELVKFSLILFNLLCLIGGVTLVGLSSQTLIGTSKSSAFSDMVALNHVAIILLTLAIVVVCVALLGCLGAMGGSPAQLRIYSFVMVVLLIGQLTFVIYVWTRYDHTYDYVRGFIKTLWKHRNDPNASMHKLEERFKCCGQFGAEDYEKYKEKIPGTCCKLPVSEHCEKNIFPSGCITLIEELWMSCSNLIKYGLLSLSGLMLLASVFASYLAQKLRQQQHSSD